MAREKERVKKLAVSIYPSTLGEIALREEKTSTGIQRTLDRAFYLLDKIWENLSLSGDALDAVYEVCKDTDFYLFPPDQYRSVILVALHSTAESPLLISAVDNLHLAEVWCLVDYIEKRRLKEAKERAGI